MLITGKWFPKGSATQHKAILSISEDIDSLAHKNSDEVLYSISIEGVEAVEDVEDDETNETIHSTLSGSLCQLKIEPRLGNIDRKIELPDGSIFITSDNDSVDKLVPRTRSNRFFLWLYRQEVSFKRIIVFVLLVLMSVVAFIWWGVPWTSKKIATIMPTEIRQVLGRQTLELVDRLMLEESKLDEKTKQEITKRFNEKLLPLLPKSDVNYTLHFRAFPFDSIDTDDTIEDSEGYDDVDDASNTNDAKTDTGIANAFALPSGDIVVTDKLVQISKNPDELDSVLLHEVGHIVNRHGLQSVVQKSVMTIVVLSVIGDADGLVDLIVGTGTAVIANSYSRHHESEADDFAFQKMLQANINPQSFGNILGRIERDMKAMLAEKYNVTQEEIGGEIDKNADNKGTAKKYSDLFSTHPNTKGRIQQAERYSNCFTQKLTVCPQ